jgi:hypothetical protein
MSEEEEEIQSSETKLPLQGVVIFVSQQLGTNRTALHQQCTTLGGKFVWVFDLPFTHYVCQVRIFQLNTDIYIIMIFREN